MRLAMGLQVAMGRGRKNNGAYDQFVQWAKSKGYVQSQDTVNVKTVVSEYGKRLIVNMTQDGGVLYGSPYGTYFNDDATLSRLILHAMPDRNTFDECLIAKRLVLMKMVSVGSPTVVAVTRNGFTSTPYGQAYASARMDEFVFWDETLKKPRVWNPYSRSAITDFVMN